MTHIPHRAALAHALRALDVRLHELGTPVYERKIAALRQALALVEG